MWIKKAEKPRKYTQRVMNLILNCETATKNMSDKIESALLMMEMDFDPETEESKYNKQYDKVDRLIKILDRASNLSGELLIDLEPD